MREQDVVWSQRLLSGLGSQVEQVSDASRTMRGFARARGRRVRRAVNASMAENKKDGP